MVPVVVVGEVPDVVVTVVPVVVLAVDPVVSGCRDRLRCNGLSCPCCGCWRCSGSSCH